MVDAIDLLRQAFPDVGESVLQAIAQLARIKTYPSGTTLCVEGETGDTFYLVGDGEVKITKQMQDGEVRILRQGTGGEFFGEMALLHDTVRSATVTTVLPTTVIEIDRTTFVAAIQQNPTMVLTIIRTMIERMRANDAQALRDLQIEKAKVEKAYDELRLQEQKRDEFLDTIAHEMRTPLTAAKGYIQLLKAGALSGAALTMGIEKINVSFNRIISLVNDLLFVQEMELLDFGFSKINIGELITEAVDELKSMTAQSPAVLRVDVANGIPPLIADHDGLVRAFVHLLDNAFKFSPAGGEIIITARATDTHLDVSFQDHGVGIPDDFMPRLFERFERVETYKEYLFGGLGLGLPIVKHIIESHGGHINVESHLGKGSIFHIHLPIDAKRATSNLTPVEQSEWVDVPEDE
jgi:signal transduction histidine kinase